MNVLMVTERYVPIWGGAENQLRQLTRLLVAQGHSVTVITRRWKADCARKEMIDNVPVRRIGRPGIGPLATIVFALSLMQFLIRERRHYQIVHSHGAANMGALIALAALLTRQATVAKIATAGRIPKLRQQLWGRLVLVLFKRVDAVICMSAEIREELQEIGVNTKRIWQIENGVDTSRFSPGDPDERRCWRLRRGLPEDAVLVVFAGRLVQRKGVDVLIDAWQRLKGDELNAYLFILGSGTDQPDSVEGDLVAKIGDQHIASVQLEGEVAMPETYLNVADIFAFPSRKEGFPNALLEAMAAGAAVVASRIGGNQDLVTDGQTGVLFDTNDVAELAGILHQLIVDTSRRKGLAERARAHVKVHNSIKVICRHYSDLYVNLAK